MKTILVGLLLTVVHSSILFAQKSPSKFGDIPMDDIKMTTYDHDSSASAVILMDFGKCYITENAVSLILNFERHFRIKILSNDALHPGGPADIEIPLLNIGTDEEKVTSLKAVTYNLENGAIVETKLSKDGIFKQKFNKNISLQTFTLPNVKVGSVIEVSYTVTSDFLFNFHNWQFQYKIPVRSSEYWALIPDVLVVTKYQQGYIPITDYESKPQNTSTFQVEAHHWKAQRVPAFKTEPFMTCEKDYVTKVNFAVSQIVQPGRPIVNVMKSWASLNNTLVDEPQFGKLITGSGFLKKKAEELTAGMTDPLAKATAIYNYVKQSIEWDGSKEKYPDNLKEVLENKKGSSADINFILASMFEKVGIPVEMVLLSTRDHGFIRQQYPMERQLNYVICSTKIADKTMLIDATDRLLPMGVLPERCLNGVGMLISRDNHGWITIDTKIKAKTTISADLTIDESASIKGKLSFLYDGYDAHDVRQEYFGKGEQDFVKSFLNNRSWLFEKTEFQNVNDFNTPAKQIHDVVISEHATVTGNVMYVNPFVTNQLTDNVFKAQQREYPVDFGSPQEETYMAKINIPEGFVLDEIPKSRVLMLPGNAARYTYNISVTGNVITAVSIFQINKSLFVQSEYADLREFYNHVVAKQAEQIVLKKKI
ncbi:transglutaminase domain-containing protein [Pseudochryseolinea flava]|uniref:DUF3857 domain-containing protein n=1 Tax=Pseudochryseolinea flava TaxID=2059302 RepID=A0A364Y7R1_9BACT|nr:DUF3857 domain-containing protein [Pseudochryseolinea flava]RAW03146.1 hypothetical protein DQQ10_03350 [Pseudochryseolinea flava]